MIKRFLPLAALTLAISTAYAAPVPGPAGEAFYTTPTTLPAANGELITYRQTAIDLKDPATSGVKAWTVMYSTRSNSKMEVATGTVIMPAGTPAGVILYAVGTHGLGKQCAASKQLAAGTDYENANIAAAIKAGYAVLVSDYVGYTSGKKPRYMAGASQGRNVLDIFKAATQIPSVGIDASAKVAIWGFSQGGQASSFAAQLQPTYAPGMNVVGVATGGIPGDFFTTAEYLDGRNGSSFLLATVLGLYEEYGQTRIPLPLLISPAGQAEITQMESKCVFEALFDYQNRTLSSYTKDGTPLQDLLDLTSVTLEEQTVGKTKINFPVYQFHGTADQFIPLAQAFETKKRWCALGTTVKFDAYPSEHIATQFQAAPSALAWIKDRFAGVAAPNSCSTNTAPVANPQDNSGNIKVELNKWPLTANVVVKGLKQTVFLPTGPNGSSFTAITDINDKTLNGSLFVPEFKQSLKILGIGAQVGLKITPVGATVGTAELTRDGKLNVTGKAVTDITVTSVWGIPFGQCKTEKPVEFPLNFSGGISSLGAGLSFTGTTTFPPIKGCIISAIISALMSGTGQQYTFVVNPPAPKAN